MSSTESEPDVVDVGHSLRTPSPPSLAPSLGQLLLGIAFGAVVFLLSAAMDLIWRHPRALGPALGANPLITTAALALLAGVCVVVAGRFRQIGIASGLSVVVFCFAAHVFGGGSTEIQQDASTLVVLLAGGAGAFPLVFGAVLICSALVRS